MINYNYKDINIINFNVSIDECFSELRPHPKFKDCTFDNYHDDDAYPTQAALKELLRSISNKEKIKKRSFFSKKQKENKHPNHRYPAQNKVKHFPTSKSNILDSVVLLLGYYAC